jgi:predicted HTH domain antitoxin
MEEKKMIQEEVEIDLKSLVAAGLYESEEKAIYEALKLLLKENPEIRKKLAIYRYKNEEITLAKAAEIAGVSLITMKSILIDSGIEPELGPKTFEQARQEHIYIKEIVDEFNHK